MQRSMAELRMKGEPAPVLHRIRNRRPRVDACRREVRRDRGRPRRPQPDAAGRVRVGDYAFDSSRFVTQDRGGGRGSVAVRSAVLSRRRLRRHPAADLAGDRCRVQARGQRVRQEEGDVPEPCGHRRRLADFSQETPVETLQPGQTPVPSGSAVGRSRQAALRGVRVEPRARRLGSLARRKRTGPVIT